MKSEERFIEDVRQSSEEALAAFFERRNAALIEGPIGRSILLEEIEALTLRGGKRLRPILIAASAWAIDPDFKIADAAPLYCAIEILQSALLIHDDIMDEDEIRRGGPSTYASLRRRLGDMKRGDAAAILAGDYAAALSLEALVEASPSPALFRAFSAILEEVYHGQVRDILGDKDIPLMHRLKTTSYTTLGPVRIGALSRGVSKSELAEELAALERWAIAIGEAFQVVDDLLGVIGDGDEMGKPGDDLRDGKKSALYHAALERGEEEIVALYERSERSEEEIDRLGTLLEERGILAHTRERVIELEREANAALERAPIRDEARALFHALGARLTRRAR